MSPTQLEQGSTLSSNEEIKNAVSFLKKFKINKLTLKRPVFFIPGWRDDNCHCWALGKSGNLSMKDWLKEVITNLHDAYFINFLAESKQYKSFLSFGESLKKKIWANVGMDQEFDVVAHDMAGLEIRAAINPGETLQNIHTCITVATPHRGSHFMGNNNIIRKGEAFYQTLQARNLEPDLEPMKIINTKQNRQLFLERIQEFYQIVGTQDGGAPISPFLDKNGIEDLYRTKTQEVIIEGTEHIGSLSITQDPRTILTIVKILMDLS